MRMGHIFISYSHKDSKYVEKLEKKLIEEGFTVWIDHRIDYGTRWPIEIQRALDSCDAFFVVVTENALESEWVQNEVARAKRKGKPFFPLLLQGDPWLSVEATQYADVRDGSLPPESFYKRLEKVTRRKEQPIRPVEPAPLPPQPVKPGPWTKKFSEWSNAVYIPLAFIALLIFILATAFVLLPPVSAFSSYKNSFELTDIVMSSEPGIKRSKTEFSTGEAIYLTLYLTDEQATGKYETKWYYLVSLFDVNKSMLITRQENSDPGIRDYVLYEHNPLYLAGNYRVDIFKEGNLIGTNYFSVR